MNKTYTYTPTAASRIALALAECGRRISRLPARYLMLEYSADYEELRAEVDRSCDMSAFINETARRIR